MSEREGGIVRGREREEGREEGSRKERFRECVKEGENDTERFRPRECVC